MWKIKSSICHSEGTNVTARIKRSECACGWIPTLTLGMTIGKKEIFRLRVDVASAQNQKKKRAVRHATKQIIWRNYRKQCCTKSQFCEQKANCHSSLRGATKVATWQSRRQPHLRYA